MKKNLFRNAFIAFISLALMANVFTSCDDDDKKDNPVDKTALTTLITECETLANGATSDDYPENAIVTFKSLISAAKTAVANTSITQTAVDNLVVQLTEGKRVFLASAYGAIPESALLIGLSFNEGTGTELKAAGKNLTAKLTAGPSELFGNDTGLPTFVDGKVGKAMKFAHGSHLEISDYSAADFQGQELSIAVWLKPDSTRAGNYVMSYNYWNSWKFQIQEQNKPFMTVSTTAGITDADNQSDVSVPNDAWTHVVVSLNLKTQKMVFYINGTLTMEWDATGKPNLSGTITPYEKVLPIMIGTATTYAEAVAEDWSWALSKAKWDYFAGTMDELKVYNIALTEGQVKKLYKDEN